MTTWDALHSGSLSDSLLLAGESEIDLGAAAVAIFVLVVVVLRLLSLRKNGMRAKCPKCGEVFDMPFGPGLHIGPWKYGRCPGCDKGGMMRTGVKDPLTWPEAEGAEEPKDGPADSSNEGELERRIRDSKYE